MIKCKELHCFMQLYSVLMVIHNIQLSRNFREIKFYFREIKKNFREGFQHNMHGFRN